MEAQETGNHHAICPRDTNTATTGIPASRHTVTMFLEDRSTDSKMMGRSSKNKGLVEDYHALVVAFVAALITGLFCFYALILLELRYGTHEWFQGLRQNVGLYQQEGASNKNTVKQNSGGPGGVWNRLCSVFGVLAYFWVHDPDWYPGSVLSKITSIFRDVSLYTVAILLAVYMIDWTAVNN